MNEFAALLVIACLMVAMLTMPIWFVALIILIDPTNDEGEGSGKSEAKAYLIETLHGLKAANKFRQSEQDKRRGFSDE